MKKSAGSLVNRHDGEQQKNQVNTRAKNVCFALINISVTQNKLNSRKKSDEKKTFEFWYFSQLIFENTARIALIL